MTIAIFEGGLKLVEEHVCVGQGFITKNQGDHPFGN